jgi:hypothetical protein
MTVSQPSGCPKREVVEIKPDEQKKSLLDERIDQYQSIGLTIGQCYILTPPRAPRMVRVLKKCT